VAQAQVGTNDFVFIRNCSAYIGVHSWNSWQERTGLREAPEAAADQGR
jgi:hypothetical protein